MKIINNSTSIVGLPGIGEIGAGEFVEVTAAQIDAIESLPIVAKWIKTGAIAIDRDESMELTEDIYFSEHDNYFVSND